MKHFLFMAAITLLASCFLSLASGRLLWEFRNVHDISAVLDNPAGDVARFATQTVTYFNQADFVCNEGQP